MSYTQRASSRLAFPFVAGLPLVALLLAWPTRADAQVCATNSECPVGTSCQQTSVPGAEPGCSGAGCPTPGTGGTSGKALVAPDAVRMTCAPAPCTTDADCGGQMVCHTETYAVCTGGTAPACARDTKCDPVPTTATTCTETKVSACAYKWQQPCNVSADCGDGFTCEPTMITSCSGGGPVTGGGTTGTASPGTSGPVPVGAGGSSGSSEAADAPARVAPAVDGGTTDMCTTTTSFPGWCKPKATTCNTDADCPAAWTCVDGNTSSGGSGVSTDPGSSGSGTGGVARPASADGGAASLPAPLVAAVKVCQSPVSFPVRGGTATDLGGSKGPATSGATPPGDGNGAPEVATHGSGAGCSVAGTSTASLGGAAALLLAVALVTGLRVRRARNRL